MTNRNFKNSKNSWICFIALFLRLSIAILLLSWITDRFGLWAGSQETVVWGSFSNYTESIKNLFFFVPEQAIQSLAWSLTIIELILAIFLLLGIFVRFSAVVIGLWLLFLGVLMSLNIGLKMPIDSGLFIAAFSAWTLPSIGSGFLALDKLFD